MKPLIHFIRRSVFVCSVIGVLIPAIGYAQRHMEHLGRGVVAIHQSDGKVAVSWRLLGTDPEGITFNLYRKSEPVPGRAGSGFGSGSGAPSAIPGSVTPGQPPTKQGQGARGQGRGGTGGGRGGFGGVSG